MTTPQLTNSKLDLSNIQTYNRNATWTQEKKDAIAKAIEMYPQVPQIAIEVAYDFSLKFDDDPQMDKYLKGEFLSKTDRKKLRRRFNPTNYKIARNDYQHDTEIKTVDIKPAEKPIVNSNVEVSNKSWYNIF